MRVSSINGLKLLAACCTDLILGDPQKMPHPVRLMGRGISAGERLIRRSRSNPASEIILGGTLTAVVVATSWATARFLIATSRRATPLLGDLTEVLLAWTSLATRSLIVEASAVLDILDTGDVAAARASLAMIVGRDTALLDEPEIVRAVIETVAESLCDGVIAPLTYIAAGGVPLALAYKAVNTLDSMIGHRDAPYLYFGRVAARLDDVANFVPARLTALSIVAAAFVTGYDWRSAWVTFRIDGHKHPSPNAGRSEAAMAGAIGVRLGGMNYYGGQRSLKPYLGETGRRGTPTDARSSLRIAAVASVLASAAAIVWCVWRSRTSGEWE